MGGVFLSYAREDLPFVRRLHDALGAAGREPAWDQDHPHLLGQPLTGGTGPVLSLAFSPDGHTLASGSIDGTIRIWNLNVNEATERICTTAGDVTPTQWQTHISQQLPYRSPCAR